MTLDLDTMSKEELEKLRKETDRKLKDYDHRRRAEARQAAEKVAKEHGYTLEEIMGESRRASKPSPARYRHPENPAKTWTGRGRKPGWVNAHLTNGGALEDLSI